MENYVRIIYKHVGFKILRHVPAFCMQTKVEKEKYLDMIKHGDLDIIVGTHSLLGSRVVYNNLGLLVVDEEQVSSQSQ